MNWFLYDNGLRLERVKWRYLGHNKKQNNIHINRPGSRNWAKTKKKMKIECGFVRMTGNQQTLEKYLIITLLLFTVVNEFNQNFPVNCERTAMKWLTAEEKPY